MTHSPKDKGRILLIDHDDQWIEKARLVLAGLGYEVQGAATITDALALSDVYDLILMNWAQADHELLLLSKLAQPDVANSPCVVVMFPIQKSPQRMRAVFKAGAYDCVDKPFEKREIVELVDILEKECKASKP
jgi:DNA-binding response OmpR family regulator